MLWSSSPSLVQRLLVRCSNSSPPTAIRCTSSIIATRRCISSSTSSSSSSPISDSSPPHPPHLHPPRFIDFPDVRRDDDDMDTTAAEATALSRVVSIETANQRQLTKHKINVAIKKFQKHRSDTGSAAVQSNTPYLTSMHAWIDR